MRAGWATAIGLAWLVVVGGTAQATWSIVAIDSQTREVGVAGASCILGSEIIAIVVPGRGAGAAQAVSNLDGREKLRHSLSAGTSAAAALEEVATGEFDSFLGVPTLKLRQYGVVSLGEPDAAAHFTGSWTPDWAGAETARGVSVQGNTLVGPEVVSRALAAFTAEAEGCRARLADRLVAALVAGAEAGGDGRCVPDLSALSAFVYVASPDDAPDTPRLQLVRNRPDQPPWSIWQEIRNAIRPVPGARDENPVLLLKEAYRRWAVDSGPGPACLPGSAAEPG